MSDFAKPGKQSSLEVGYTGSRVPEQKPRERTAEEKAVAANTIAANLTNHDHLVSQGVTDMQAAVAAREEELPLIRDTDIPEGYGC